MKKNVAPLLIFFVGLHSFLQNAVWARTARGVVYYSGATPENKGSNQYSFEMTDTKDGSKRSVTLLWKTKSGQVLVEENATLVDGLLQKYGVQQKQIGENALAEVKGNKLHFEKTAADGSVSRDEEDYDSKVLVMGQMEDFVKSHWDDLMAGETLKVKFAVVFRKETIGFALEKEKEAIVSGKNAIIVKVKPSSFFISLFVNPLRLYLESSGDHRLLQLEGRLPIKVITGENDWSDIEGKLVID